MPEGPPAPHLLHSISRSTRNGRKQGEPCKGHRAGGLSKYPGPVPAAASAAVSGRRHAVCKRASRDHGSASTASPRDPHSTRAQRDATLACLEDPSDELAELRGLFAQDDRYRPRDGAPGDAPLVSRRPH